VARRYAAAAAILSLAALPQVLAQPAGTQPVPDGNFSVVMRCKECGVINSIREIQQRRDGVTPGLGPDSPVGLVIFIPIGPGSEKGDSFAGSVGNKEWQNRLNSTRFEYTVRMDNGDFRMVQKDGVSNLQVGDRVRLDRGGIERWGT
jgi:outer membrane lipoprotein SlyB